MKVRKSQKADYPYEARMHEIGRINGINYKGVKYRALQRFESQETVMLSQRENPSIRSQPLDVARRAIVSIREEIHREQHGISPVLQRLQRNLFPLHPEEVPPADVEPAPLPAPQLGLFFARPEAARRLHFTLHFTPPSDALDGGEDNPSSSLSLPKF